MEYCSGNNIQYNKSLEIDVKLFFFNSELFVENGADLKLMLYLKAAILKGYPSEMTVVSFYCFFGTIQSAILTLIVEKNPNAWALRLDMELISILYSVST